MNNRELAHATGLEQVGENVHGWKMPNGKPLSEWIVLSPGVPSMLKHIMPNGKVLGECTREDLEAFGELMGRAAAEKLLKP